MQKTVKIKIIVAVIIIAAIGLGVWQYKKHQQAKEQEALAEALDYSQTAVESIVGTWNPKELQDRAHESLLKTIGKSGFGFADYFNVLRKLGKLKPGGKCNLSNLLEGKEEDNNTHFVYADFICDAQFDNGEAKILIEIRQDPGATWKINTFRVDSPLFAPPKTAADAKKAPESPKPESTK